MSKVIQTVEELDAVLHWRRKHAQAMRAVDAGKDREAALQQRLTAADELADVLEGLLRTSLVAMTRIYSAGRDFIVGAGSDCDSVELMMENDPTAREIRAALKPAEGGGDEALTQFQSRDDMAGFLLHALSVLRSHHLYGELPSVTSCVHDCLRLIGEPIPPRGW